MNEQVQEAVLLNPDGTPVIPEAVAETVLVQDPGREEMVEVTGN